MDVSITVTTNQMSATNSNSSGGGGGNTATNSTKKHGFGFRRFSLRRLFNQSSIARTVSTRHSKSPKEKHLDTGLATETKSVGQRPTCSTYSANAMDGESYSLSSGRSDCLNHTMAASGAAYDNSSCSSGAMECPLCLLEQPYSHFPELCTCSHRACHPCLQQYLKIEILESRININCPECTEPLHPNDIQKILNFDANLMEKYETFMLRRILVTEPDARWCPAPDCSYCVIASGCASCPKLKCERPGCETSFCYHCKQEWHPNQTCDAARQQRGQRFSRHGKSSSVSFSHDSIVQRDDIKPCPCCKVLIIKMDDGSCNHMTCSVCGTEFCWLCMKEISDLHYLSPSGCTFWGKKPWSRKKKIMWQLGMLVGAPVGIALIAGIAVPAIIIGIPVWVGRKLHARFERHQMRRHKRNILVTTGVLTSIFVSPILAAVAVGIGVPILLAYVYGVVPISLCRSGGCGVITSASGVRIELDEENEIAIGSNVAADGVSVDTALSNRGVNPSIGEVSLGLSTSLSMGSATHIDRIGGACDRENGSTAACAGSIASGTLSTAAHNKVEIQADVSSNKRFSLSSHCETVSATLSFGDRSTNISYMDDSASVKALAGSIVGYCSNSVTPVEVHTDPTVRPITATDTKSLCYTGGCEQQLSPDSRVSIENNYSISSPYGDYSVNYIDDTPSPPSDQLNSDQVFTSHSSNGYYYYSQTKHLIGKFESRSLEQLTNYCELCHKSHKPCCPNYNISSQKLSHKSANKSSTQSMTRRQQCRSVGGGGGNDENSRPVTTTTTKSKSQSSSSSSSSSSKRRTSSTKSRKSSTASSVSSASGVIVTAAANDYAVANKMHRSDCNITESPEQYNKRNNSSSEQNTNKLSLIFNNNNSIPTSTATVNELPTTSSSSSTAAAHDHQYNNSTTRAYTKNSFSNIFMQTKATTSSSSSNSSNPQQMPIIKTSDIKTNFCENNNHKSSEV
ncbi:E3 ubiquitin-protein ligase RNF19B-like [Oppia nitens]|uniref:E3 ubiquitin-protein ligase RNF19B-like n=1 Tax=Oppia nitens TaxID=1686743 RepID=UPI0023D9C2D7|nr:E3 ubiquitin-protein ligase RNF19B-like [Oppia nitens]